jgi:hypothetical protein
MALFIQLWVFYPNNEFCINKIITRIFMTFVLFFVIRFNHFPLIGSITQTGWVLFRFIL